MLAGADPDGDEAEEAQQQVGGEVDGADPLAGQGAALDEEEAGVEVDALLADPVAGAVPADPVGARRDPDDADGRGERPEHRAGEPEPAGEAEVAGTAAPATTPATTRAVTQTVRGSRRRQPSSGGVRGLRGAHVASPGVLRVMRVSRSASSAATSWSRPSIRTAPLEEAVVTVTVASRWSCSSGPRTVSTV